MIKSAASEPVKMGDITRSTGVSDQTVRYYERLGLIRSVGRTQGGFRLFRPDAIEQIQVIKMAQSLGFRLDEISGLLDASTRDDAGCREAKAVLSAKLEELDERIALLARHRDALRRIQKGCERCEGPCLVQKDLACSPLSRRAEEEEDASSGTRLCN